MITSAMATIFCADLDRSVPFYTDILGLKLVFRAGADWASLDNGNPLYVVEQPKYGP